MTRILRKPPQWKSPRANKYFGAMYNATPKWLDEKQVADFYMIKREANRLNNMGFNVEVDHIVPLVSEHVCGLNVPWNLKIVASKINNRKGNKYWVDMPTIDLVGYDIPQIEPPPKWQQLRLKI
jgi:hypothetical protein